MLVCYAYAKGSPLLCSGCRLQVAGCISVTYHWLRSNIFLFVRGIVWIISVCDATVLGYWVDGIAKQTTAFANVLRGLGYTFTGWLKSRCNFLLRTVIVRELRSEFLTALVLSIFLHCSYRQCEWNDNAIDLCLTGPCFEYLLSTLSENICIFLCFHRNTVLTFMSPAGLYDIRGGGGW
jgi:hypothetical protein